ncbi:MAG: ATP-binding cassette domain-containing protein, partial [Gammaproteobacteria bacterium]|nr:ATP-binding cassette domain-containing protein [Gammaproteobacteria bacterium]
MRQCIESRFLRAAFHGKLRGRRDDRDSDSHRCRSAGFDGRGAGTLGFAVTALEAMPGTAVASEDAIAISGLRFGYGSGDDILVIRELKVRPSQRVFVFGPSGCGKSTLLALVGGVLV